MLCAMLGSSNMLLSDDCTHHGIPTHGRMDIWPVVSTTVVNNYHRQYDLSIQAACYKEV